MTAQAIATNFTRQSRSKVASVAIFALLLTMLAVISPAERASASVTPSPGLTEISPAAGPGGITVTITGSNFTGTRNSTLEVFFRSAEGNITASTSTTLTVEVPTGSSGLADVRIETPAGTVTLEDAFLYRSSLSRPTVTRVDPPLVSLSGNTEVVISGTGFTDVSRVRFGSVDAVEYRVESSSKIVAVVPASSTPGNAQVLVTNSTGTSTSALNLKYSEACEIASYANVRFEYRSSKLTKATRKVIRDTVKEMVLAECGAITLVRYNASITASTSAAHRAYINLQRARAKAVGDLIETRLELIGSTAKVSFAKFSGQKSQAAVANWDSKKSYQRVAIAHRAFTAPAVTLTYPAVGNTSGNTTVTIKGSNLEDVTSVKFGSSTATFTINDDDEITASAPAGSAGVVNITVSGPNGSVVRQGAFRYAASSTISSISTSSSTIAGSNAITINGTNFYGLRNVDDVRFGSVNAAYFSVVSPTRIIAIVPSNSSGTKSLIVTTGAGSDSENFTYRAAPIITSVSPSAVPTDEDSIDVVINGTNFSGSVSVRFGSSSAGVDDVNDAFTQIETKAPERSSAAAVDITVSTSGGTAVLTDGFRYGGEITVASGESNEISILTTTASGSVDLNTIFDLNDAFDEDPVTWEISLGTGTFDALTAFEFLTETGLAFDGTTGVISWTEVRPAVAEKTLTVRVTQSTPAVTATSTIKIEIVVP